MSSNIDLSETLSIALTAIVTTSIAEFASWYFVYRTEEYKELANKIESGLSKYNKQKEQFVKQTQQRTHDKKVSHIETQLKQNNQELTMLKMKSNLAIGLLAIITLTSLGSHYQGIPVAKLPFVPFSLLQNVTHRGLFGTDYTDCSYIVIYILTAFIWRANVQRIFGFEGPKLPFGYPGSAGQTQSLFSK